MVERKDHYRDTIFALSSGAGVSGVAVIRLSGPSVRFGLETMIGDVPEARHATLKSLYSADKRELDRGLVLYFPGPNSFTGEDCAELQVHGGRAVVQAVLECLSGLDGFRSAEPGEFTRRAFDNGKMDLTEVEGLADLIAAETEMQRRLALEQSSGSLSDLYDGWRQRLVRARAMIEADFDFADEEDIPGSVTETIWPELRQLLGEIDRHLLSAKAGEIIRDGYRVVILGAPNAGKSSLMNALAKRDIAIVSDEKGTTRDLLEVHLDLDGYPVILQDTAGLRDGAGAVEREGMRRAMDAARRADLILLLDDLSGRAGAAPVTDGDVARLRVGTKADLAAHIDRDDLDCLVSVKQDDGLSSLLSLLHSHVHEAAGQATGTLPNRQRHKEYLRTCREALEEALENDSDPLELRAEALRRAGNALGRLTGRIDVEDLLDLIFGEFCVGK
ncbi:tRNA uridine-5-carboxymethylaminomethyl(34) synthesis GTPase MnmE [Hoeflea prorocentri]|uniref:tRNA modification GTPase MnmE n=1 Tax=Hoeflea prorocentri TaxID=1922333 RepID=A0A9X3ZJ76_9HYPH|nr:tRNA uridine-5-carboxymethylaminomethyl(34) synthesis GTPase MnmE [Hoeflea prorocentri]MCY6383174.1 tRNA uridine-5-carboxymethylaminomethyl(34) synthesis GTPase MnmE [Hoeflea prorocentri]MDA5400974.1 tRNA uridine-5-carboxymethylaminomethyl(34) synthesis GTPase MnmE [Hoeflea prorocentri]